MQQIITDTSEVTPMEPIIRALGRFASRDLMYVVGGLSVILAFKLAFDIQIIPIDPSTAQLFFAIGLAYPLGYVVPGTLSLTRLLTTSIVLRPPSCLRSIFSWWAGMDWNVPCGFDAHEAYYQLYKAEPEQIAAFERPIFLKHIGTTIGANWLVCALLLFIAGHRPVAAAALLASLLLILLGWLEGMEANLALHRWQQWRQSAS
jgi:hypothetical protein